MQSGMFFPPYGDTIGSIVVKHVNGQLVDVLSGKIYPACVNMFEGKVVRIERKVSAPLQYILPGLIDSHVHIESSSLTPYRFAEQAVVHGTTAVVADPSPTAAAAGVEGIRRLMENGRATPMRFRYAVPSSLPASTGLDWRAVRQLMSEDEFVALSEVTEVGNVLDEEAHLMANMEVARQFGKPVDGYAPGLRGYDLDRYIMAGITSDRGCLTSKEALEKQRRAMTIVVEEGSATRQLEALAGFMKGNRHLMATGDIGAADLVRGHLDALLRKAVALGVDPMQAIKAVTLWPAERYNLPGGSLYVGGTADLTVVSDLKEFNVLETWIGGEMVAKGGVPLFLGNPPAMPIPFSSTKVQADEMEPRSPSPVARARVLEVNARGMGAGRDNAELSVQNGRVMPDPRRDIALLALVDPRGAAPPLVSFVKGFGLGQGAIATSYVIGATGVLAVGSDAVSLSDVVNLLLSSGGGRAAVRASARAMLALPEGGMMSSFPAAEVARAEEDLRKFILDMGSPLPDPLLTLSYLGREARWAFDLEPVLEMRSA